MLFWKDLSFPDGSLPKCDNWFGMGISATDKARYAVPNKLIEPVEAPTLTMNSPGLREFFKKQTFGLVSLRLSQSLKIILTITGGVAYPGLEANSSKVLNTFSSVSRSCE